MQADQNFILCVQSQLRGILLPPLEIVVLSYVTVIDDTLEKYFRDCKEMLDLALFVRMQIKAGSWSFSSERSAIYERLDEYRSRRNITEDDVVRWLTYHELHFIAHKDYKISVKRKDLVIRKLRKYR